MSFMCKDVVDNMLEYIDLELDDETLKALESHTAECPECSEFVRTYKKMLWLSGKLKERSFVTPEIRERLKKLLKQKLSED